MPPASTPAPAAPAPAEISAAWRNALLSWLQANRTYPDGARRRGEEGTAVIRFTVDRGGRVSDLILVRGSGSSLLDEAAMQQVRGRQAPAFPASMTQEVTTVTVPIRYKLD